MTVRLLRRKLASSIRWISSERSKRSGWVLARTEGSHHQFRHPNRPGVVTVVHPLKDVPIGTMRAIAKSAGIKLP
jgi:predicted RNA binding protein YcfA (HicA-like mRNA interferase family)